ncbi:MAG: hypothetical protein HUU10_15175 [Bacteroidetes bacterium]|nr:hypothetical protein [Bacteroidota bacterium]
MDQWFEVFRIGKHTDSAGNSREWTEADLDLIVSNYRAEEHEAPIVIGHPKDNDPAYGWVEALKREGSILLAKAKQVVPEFAEAVKSGLFKKRSISLYPDMTLRHVGFLGAVPPAVKGLADLQFADKEIPVVIEFGEDAPAQEPVQPEVPMVSKAEFDALQKRLELFESRFAEMSTQQIEDKQRSNWLNREKLSFQSYLLDRLQFGTITPAQKTQIESLVEVLDGFTFKSVGDQGGYAVEFSEGKTANPFDLLRKLVDTFPKQIEFTEVATGANAGPAPKEKSPVEIAREAQNYQEEMRRGGVNISISDAVDHVIKNKE